jgi:hypothetical protein
MAGVGLSSVLAGEASRRLSSHWRGQPLLRRPREVAADAAMDAAIGIVLFKASIQAPNCLPSTPAASAVQAEAMH